MKFLRERAEGGEGVPRPGSREGIRGDVSDFPDRYAMRSCRSLNIGLQGEVFSLVVLACRYALRSCRSLNIDYREKCSICHAQLQVSQHRLQGEVLTLVALACRYVMRSCRSLNIGLQGEVFSLVVLACRYAMRSCRYAMRSCRSLNIGLQGEVLTLVALVCRYAMRSCRSLNIASKELGSVPISVFEEAREAEVTSVDLSKNCLSRMPDGLFCLSDKLTDLNLSCNSLTSVPKEIGKLWRLQYLALDRNMLTDLPQDLATMDKLRELVLSYNNPVYSNGDALDRSTTEAGFSMSHTTHPSGLSTYLP
uniref:(California timema) hypothetical protein n=1 Tax=Timema californicum TaxID=61474 RepID=A0A7R9JJ95_TIMCA|nr:unnamed protein product [Timema californicum]